uniref:Uncharacterized protein n=1 Tax=Tetranychus urticae TaxID=32264 RepID=T1KQV7_TETUR
MALIQSQMVYLTVAFCVLSSFIVNSEPIRTTKPDVNPPETGQEELAVQTTESTLKDNKLKSRHHHYYDMGYGHHYGYGYGYPMMGGYDYLAPLMLFGR